MKRLRPFLPLSPEHRYQAEAKPGKRVSEFSRRVKPSRPKKREYPSKGWLGTNLSIGNYISLSPLGGRGIYLNLLS
jgi:hypothetical protein